MLPVKVQLLIDLQHRVLDCDCPIPIPPLQGFAVLADGAPELVLLGSNLVSIDRCQLIRQTLHESGLPVTLRHQFAVVRYGGVCLVLEEVVVHTLGRLLVELVRVLSVEGVKTVLVTVVGLFYVLQVERTLQAMFV